MSAGIDIVTRHIMNKGTWKISGALGGESSIVSSGGESLREPTHCATSLVWGDMVALVEGPAKFRGLEKFVGGLIALFTTCSSAANSSVRQTPLASLRQK